MYSEPLKFPKTANLHEIFENSDTESKTIVHNAKFLTTGKLIIDSFNLHENNILKGFVIKLSSASIKKVSLLINDQIIETAELISLDVNEDEKEAMFAFKVFNQNGVVQNPKLFDINFICEPIPSQNIPAQLQYQGMIVDQLMSDFLEYNQYYSIHALSDATKILAIYYAPTQKPNYNVRYLDLKDLEEFKQVISLSYLWKTPVMFSFADRQKKEKHRLITVECTPEIGMKLENDVLLRYETKTLDINNNMISKSFVVHKSERVDVEGHLISEYGLIPYSTVINTPRAEIDYDRMAEIYAAQLSALKKIYGISI